MRFDGIREALEACYLFSHLPIYNRADSMDDSLNEDPIGISCLKIIGSLFAAGRCIVLPLIENYDILMLQQIIRFNSNAAVLGRSERENQ